MDTQTCSITVDPLRPLLARTENAVLVGRLPQAKAQRRLENFISTYYRLHPAPDQVPAALSWDLVLVLDPAAVTANLIAEAAARGGRLLWWEASVAPQAAVVAAVSRAGMVLVTDRPFQESYISLFLTCCSA